MKSVKQSNVRLCVLLAGAALCALLMASCAKPSGRAEIGAVTAAAYQTNHLPRRIELLRTPREIREDFIFPTNMVRSIYRWRGGDMEWRLMLPSDINAGAGFTFRKPYDLSQDRTAVRLCFRIKPAYMAKNLKVGLVDGDANPPNIIVHTTLANDAPPLDDGWRHFSITLDAFESIGTPVTSILEGQAQEMLPFDWTDVRELCLLSEGATHPNTEITIKDVRLIR